MARTTRLGQPDAVALENKDVASVLRFVDQQLGIGRSDVIHDLLAYLSERMMELNHDKHASANQFLTDLKDSEGRLESRHGRAAVRPYH